MQTDSIKQIANHEIHEPHKILFVFSVYFVVSQYSTLLLP
jgi:hypothetical protein